MHPLARCDELSLVMLWGMPSQPLLLAAPAVVKASTGQRACRAVIGDALGHALTASIAGSYRCGEGLDWTACL